MRKEEENAFLVLCCVCSSRNNLKRIMSLIQLVSLQKQKKKGQTSASMTLPKP